MNDIVGNVNIILTENSIFFAIKTSRDMLSSCSQRCHNSIKKGPNSNFQVKCCVSACKIKIYGRLVSQLSSLKGRGMREETINKKIKYFATQLEMERVKYKKYRIELKKRQTKVPVDSSLKPSPERWNPKKLN